MNHDPDTQTVYIPGQGQNVARYLDRLTTRMAPLVSQFIRHGDSDRLYASYVVRDKGSFYPCEKEELPTNITYDPKLDQPLCSGLFLQDLQHWDQMLTGLLDPVVAAG